MLSKLRTKTGNLKVARERRVVHRVYRVVNPKGVSLFKIFFLSQKKLVDITYVCPLSTVYIQMIFLRWNIYIFWLGVFASVTPKLTLIWNLFLGPNPKGWGPIDLGCSSVCPSVIDYVPGYIFVTDGRWDLGIGAYERSWRVDVLFDTFGHRKLAENAKSCDFPKYKR